MRRRALLAPALVLALMPVAGCSASDGQEGDDTTITVLAAASLTETFTELAGRFEEDHPGVDVRLAFDSSATLAQQAVEGAPADVLATADTATMDGAADVLAADPEVFATNTLVLVTPADNPAGIQGVDDLAGSTYVVCVETAPCGKVARTLLDADDVTTPPASLEVDVKAVLARVTADEADAGLVYATDAVAAGDAVETFDLPGADQHVSAYPIAPLDQSGDADLAQEFVDLVLSSDGQGVLADAGFGPPGA